MQKLNILLVCNAGMSTSLLIEKIEKVGSAHNVDVAVDARPVDDLENHLEGKDVVLLGPQVRFKLKQVKKIVGDTIPVEVIDMSAYGTMNGDKVLEQALASLK